MMAKIIKKTAKKPVKKVSKNTKKPSSSSSSTKIKKLVPKYVDMRGFLSFFILHELKSSSLSGDDLAKSVGKRKGSKLTAGTIYPALKRLRLQKLLKYRREGRKKLYYLTKEGKNELEALYRTFSSCFFGLKSRLK